MTPVGNDGEVITFGHL